MKKLLSILLSALILSTAFVIVPSTFATSNKTTYKASSTIYGNPYSTVYRKGNKILSKVGNKEVTLVNISSETYADFYVKLFFILLTKAKIFIAFQQTVKTKRKLQTTLVI